METDFISDNPVLTLLGMIFEDRLGIKLCVIGWIGALHLIVTGVISEKDALKSIDLRQSSYLEVRFPLRLHLRKQEPEN